jgi:hypothetical protein
MSQTLLTPPSPLGGEGRVKGGHFEIWISFGIWNLTFGI